MTDARTINSEVDRLVAEEVCKMIAYDNHKNVAKGVKQIKTIDFAYTDLELHELEEAKQMINHEMKTHLGVETEFDFEQFDDESSFSRKDARFYPGVKKYDGDANHSLAEQIEAKKSQFNLLNGHMQKEIKRCEKLDKYLNIMYAGYYKKEQSYKQSFD